MSLSCVVKCQLLIRTWGFLAFCEWVGRVLKSSKKVDCSLVFQPWSAGRIIYILPPWNSGLCNHLYDRDAHISSSLVKTRCWTQNMHLTESNCVFFSCLFFKILNMIRIPSSGSSNCPFQNPGCFAFLILLCLHTSCIYFHQGPGITIYYVSIFLWLLVLPTAIATTVILDPVWQRCYSSPPMVFPV